MLEDKSYQNDREWRGEDSSPLQGTQAIPLDCHGVSQIGKGRRVNQDDYLLTPLDLPSDFGQGPAFLLAVADGIGGGPAGDRASSSAIQTLHQFVRRTVAEPGLLQAIDPGELLRKAVL